MKKLWWVISWWLVTNDKIEKANHLAIYFWPGSVWKKKTSLSNRCEAKHWQSMNIYWCTATTWLPQRQEQKMDVTTYWHWSKPLPGIFFYSASMLRIQKVKHQCTCILHIFPLIGVYEHAFFKCRDFENIIIKHVIYELERCRNNLKQCTTEHVSKSPLTNILSKNLHYGNAAVSNCCFFSFCNSGSWKSTLWRCHCQIIKFFVFEIIWNEISESIIDQPKGPSSVWEWKHRRFLSLSSCFIIISFYI